MRLGDAPSAIAAAPHHRPGGADRHWRAGALPIWRVKVALAIPGEDGDLHIWSSTQHPTETQHIIARALALKDNAVTVEVRRMGGGFGGEETQSVHYAAIAALAASKTGRPAKLRMDLDDDMVATGKRHDFEIDWGVGFDGEGRLAGAVFELASRCGHSADLSMAINDRAMFHADNAYSLAAAEIVSHRLRQAPSRTTAFPGLRSGRRG